MKKLPNLPQDAAQETSPGAKPHTPHVLDHRIPPPIVTFLTAVMMWAVAQVTPRLSFEGVLRFVIPAGVGLLGVGAVSLGFVAFRRAKTTISPTSPESASSIVTGGIYRYTRNPMYVGFAIILVGWALYLAAVASLLGPVVFVLFITRFQIIPEERVLLSKFGREYANYQGQVRRWL